MGNTNRSEKTEIINGVEVPQSRCKIQVAEPSYNDDEYIIIQKVDQLKKVSQINQQSCKSLNFQMRDIAITSKYFQSFSKIYEHHNNLKSISIELNNCEIGDKEGNMLLYGINRLTQLVSLNLSLPYNKITSQGFLNCIGYISQVTSLIQLTIDMRGNDLSQLIDKIILQQYITKFTNLRSLTLNLSYCSLNDDEIIMWSEQIKKIQELEKLTLDISENGFSEDMVLQGVIMNISKLPKLKHLFIDVSVNNFTFQGVKDFFTEITQLQSLEILELDLMEIQLDMQCEQAIKVGILSLQNLKQMRLEIGLSTVENDTYYSQMKQDIITRGMAANIEFLPSSYIL